MVLHCSEWPGYVEFEFVISQPSDLTAKPSGSDLLNKVQLTSNGEGVFEGGRRTAIRAKF
jgi:hypothetical protein